MKRIMLGLIAVVLAMVVGMSFSSAAEWQEGQTWAYKWVSTWNNFIEKKMGNNSSWSGKASGKVVYGYLIKYIGKDSTGYKFSYEGGLYEYGYFKGKTSVNSFGTYANSSVDMNIKKVWIDFNGYFHLVMVNASTGAYYGIKDLSFHIYTKAPMDIFLRFNSSMSGLHIPNNLTNNRINAELKLTGNIDMNGTIRYEDPFPYIPASSDFHMARVNTQANYSGHWKVNTEGYVYASAGYGNFNGNVNYSLNKDIDTGFNGTTYVSSYMEKNGDNVSYDPVISTLPYSFLNRLLPSPYQHKWNLDAFIASPFFVATGKWTGSGMYQSITIGGHTSYPMTDTTSQKASASDINAIEENAPYVYGENVQPGTIPGYMYIVLGFVLVTAVVVTVVLVIRNKK